MWCVESLENKSAGLTDRQTRKIPLPFGDLKITTKGTENCDE